MSWLATSPYGPQRNASWMCADCKAMSGGHPEGADADTLRSGAIAHLEATGHRVSIARGTLEVLYPMATDAARQPLRKGLDHD